MGVVVSKSVQEIRLTLPLPAKPLHPNARVHWRPKADAVRAARAFARVRALEAIRGDDSTRPLPQPPRWRTANAQVTFYAPDRRRRDRDGVLASLKAAFDGIADAGVIVDDSGLIHHPVLMECDTANPRIEIRIWPSTDEEPNV